MLVRVQYVAFETTAERKTFAIAVEGGFKDHKGAAEVAWAQLQAIDNTLSIERLTAIGISLGLNRGVRSASVGDIFYVSEFSFQQRGFTGEHIFVCDGCGFVEIDLPSLNRYLKMSSRDQCMGWSWCKDRLPPATESFYQRQKRMEGR